MRRRPLSTAEGLEALLLAALDGHGWATTGTLAATWRLRNRKAELLASAAAAARAGRGRALRAGVRRRDRRPRAGSGPRTASWRRASSGRARARDRGVLLSPFDPLLWDRARVARLFGFDALLEIFKPAPQRLYGYYCLPVLAGEHLVGAGGPEGRPRQGACASCPPTTRRPARARPRGDRQAARVAVDRYAAALGLQPVW